MTQLEEWNKWLERNLPEDYDLSKMEGEFYAFKSRHRLGTIGFRKISILNPTEPKEDQEGLTQEVIVSRNKLDISHKNGMITKPKSDPAVMVDALEEGETGLPEEEAVDLQEALDLAQRLLVGEDVFAIDNE